MFYKGIEDQLNWHGKALGKESANALKAIKENIVNQGPHGLKPSSPTSVAPVVNIKNIKLSEPPNYQKGQAVRQYIYTMPSSYHHLLDQSILAISEDVNIYREKFTSKLYDFLAIWMAISEGGRL